MDHFKDIASEAVARGTIAQMTTLVRRTDDRELARWLYTEMRRLAHELAVTHQFPAEVKKAA